MHDCIHLCMHWLLRRAQPLYVICSIVICGRLYNLYTGLFICLIHVCCYCIPSMHGSFSILHVSHNWLYLCFFFHNTVAMSGTDDAGCATTDSGCDLENGSLVNLQAKPSQSPDLFSQQCNCEPQLSSSIDQTRSSVDSYSSRYSRTNHLQNNVIVERLDLPHSSDSDYDGSNTKEKGSCCKPWWIFVPCWSAAIDSHRFVTYTQSI